MGTGPELDKKCLQQNSQGDVLPGEKLGRQKSQWCSSEVWFRDCFLFFLISDVENLSSVVYGFHYQYERKLKFDSEIS